MALQAPSFEHANGRARPASGLFYPGQIIQNQKHSLEQANDRSGAAQQQQQQHQLSTSSHATMNRHDSSGGSASTPSRTRAGSSSAETSVKGVSFPSASSSSSPFVPVNINDLLAAHSNNHAHALGSLVNSHNALVGAYDSERSERSRLQAENSKLWSLCSGLKRERETVARDNVDAGKQASSKEREIRHLTARILELESALLTSGLPVPPPARDRLSPADSLLEKDANNDRRPSPGPRSLSDTNATARERQRNNMSTGTITSSTSTQSFGGYGSANDSKDSRDGNGVGRRRHGAGTPTMTLNAPTPHTYHSGTGYSSPGSGSANGSLNSSNAHSRIRERDEDVYDINVTAAPLTSSPTQDSFPPNSSSIEAVAHSSINRSGPAGSLRYAPSDAGSSSDAGSHQHPHLRIQRTSTAPISPALSSVSFGQQSQTASVSPRSPFPQPLSSPAVAHFQRGNESPRHVTLSQPTQPPPSVLQGQDDTPKPMLRRKASSLDLSNKKSELSPIHSRSATPPAHLGSPIGGQLGDAFPRTPPAQALEHSQIRTPSGRAYLQKHTTPMVELPAEARKYIIAQNGGYSIPSPVSPTQTTNARMEDDVPRESSRKPPSGLGISGSADNSSNTLSAPEVPRPRRQSSAMGMPPMSERPYGQQPSWSSQQGNGPDRQGSLNSSRDPEDPQGESVRTARPGHHEREGSGRQMSSNAESEWSTSQGDASSYAYAQPMTSQPRHPALQQPPAPRRPVVQQQFSHRSVKDDPYGRPEAGASPAFEKGTSSTGPALKCVPMVPSLLSLTQVEVVNSTLKTKTVDRQKEVVAFLVRVSISKPPANDTRTALIPPNAPTAWLVEKTWNDIQSLDNAIKAKNARSNLRAIPRLPDKSLFKDHAPSKVDQRKVDLQKFLQGICTSKLHELQDFCQFLTSNIAGGHAPVSNPGYKAGYLTKKGRNFGGWTTRYYVLQGRMLEYYDTEGGQHLGSIDIKDANIGRQNSKTTASSEDIRHAFLIRAKDKAGEETDHILCAESDEERDHWVSMLVCCVTGEYIPNTVPTVASSSSASTNSLPKTAPAIDKLKQGPHRKGSKEVEITRTAVQPISQLPHDAATSKLFNTPSFNDLPQPASKVQQEPASFYHHRREQSAGQSSTASAGEERLPAQRHGFRRVHHGSDHMVPSSSLPAHLDQIVNSDSHSSFSSNPSTQSSSHPFRQQQPHSDSETTQSGNRPRSPEKKIKISAPTGGHQIGADFKQRPAPSSNLAADRRNKAKSSFWDFASRRAQERPAAAPSRPVFGVPLQEAVEIARVREDSDLPAVLFRCVQYLSSVRAEEEEGIYRLSGSSAVIKALKDRFNAEGDVDLTTEYFDPHAVAGLLKMFLRDLPGPHPLLTGELSNEFNRANDLQNHAERVKELTRLVQLLPLANYSALRFLFAHLVQVVKREASNKMSVKNLGIVFSPTLGISSTLFAMFVTEFDPIFREVGGEEEDGEPAPLPSDQLEGQRSRTSSNGMGMNMNRRRSRNSILFTQSGADRLLEIVNDLGDAPEEDDTCDSQSEHEAARRAASPAYANPNEQAPRAGERRHKPTLNLNTADSSSADDAGSLQSQRSPSAISTQQSPRNLQAAQRSPMGPASPRMQPESYGMRRP